MVVLRKKLRTQTCGWKPSTAFVSGHSNLVSGQNLQKSKWNYELETQNWTNHFKFLRKYSAPRTLVTAWFYKINIQKFRKKCVFFPQILHVLMQGEITKNNLSLRIYDFFMTVTLFLPFLCSPRLPLLPLTGDGLPSLILRRRSRSS